jgi:hypothetical protein
MGYRLLTRSRGTGRRRQRPRPVWLAAMGVSALVVVGCSHRSSRAPTSSPAGDTPQQVALAYSQALFAGQLDVARSYVDLPSRPAMDVLGNSLRKIQVSARNLAVGSATFTGDLVLVTLTGTFCNSGTCVTNSSPQSPNPIFRVAETRSSGRWMVTFTAPSSPSNGASPSGPVGVPATVSARP